MAKESNWIQELKDASLTDQYSVCGYMRSCEKELSLNAIPPRIIYLVLSFYYQREYFDRSPQGITISKDKLKITSTSIAESYWTNLSFLKQCIDSTSNAVVEWTFKLEKKDGKNHDNSNYGLSIGFYSNYDDKYLKSNPVLEAVAPFYVHCARNREGNEMSNAWSQGQNDSSLAEFQNPAAINSDYLHNDQVKFKYDTKESKIYIQINDNQSRLLFEKIDKAEGIGYKIGICLSQNGDSVFLINFQNSESSIVH